MNIISRTFGKILYGISRFLDITLGYTIDFLEIIIDFVERIGRGIFSLFIMGCSIIFLMIPLGIFLLSPLIVRMILIFIVVPLLAKMLKSGIKFLRYVITEYLYDKSNYFIDGTSTRFVGIGDYGREYIRKEEEKKRKAEEARRRAEEERQRQQRRNFEDMFGGFGGGGFTFHDFSGQQGNFGGGNQGFGPMNIGFKEKYEEACDIIGVPYDADQNQIRSAYRKKAKKYHPDLNKAEDATEKFQKINDANEVLSEENMNRYKNLN